MNAAGPPPAGRWSLWADRNAGSIFLLPAAAVVLAFSLFPLLASFYLSLHRFKFVSGGFELRHVGWLNYKKLLFGSQQYHFLGTAGEWHAAFTFVVVAAAAALIFYLYRAARRGVGAAGMVGRVLAAAALLVLLLLFLRIIVTGVPGTLATTLVYVFAGGALQFAIGLGLALLCTCGLRGGNFFRVVFFLPLMVTPVGIAYAFRMLSDMSKGPFAPLWKFFGGENFSWAADPWQARMVVITGDSWQWIPFIFIIMLAAIENVDNEQREAARMDGADAWQVFAHVTWPAVMPAAATVVLIRAIEAFKIIDLPNILTNGGPGIATESMALHAFAAWRTLDLGGSAAVAYLLLVVSVVLSISFFNLVVAPSRRLR
ncbi:MAG: sugar ABC transporter permease [Gammaproteobacteria bacterium]|nr:sugar ABC transporter permease [Gammaproteobacteria bacterium]